MMHAEIRQLMHLGMPVNSAWDNYSSTAVEELDRLGDVLGDFEELTREEAGLLALGLPDEDTYRTFNHTFGAALWNADPSVQSLVLKMNKKSSYLSWDVKKELVGSTDPVALDFGLVLSGAYGDYAGLNRWVPEVPDAVLSSSDYRFLLVILDDPESLDHRARDHAFGILKRNAAVRTPGWFSDREHDVLELWFTAFKQEPVFADPGVVPNVSFPPVKRRKGTPFEELLVFGFPQCDDDLVGGRHGEEFRLFRDLMMEVLPLDLSLVRASLLAYALPESTDLLETYTYTAGVSLLKTSLPVREFLLTVNRRNTLLDDVKTRIASRRQVDVRMDCGAVFDSDLLGTEDVDRWLFQLPVSDLSDADFRFLLLHAPKPESLTMAVQAYVFEVIKASANASFGLFNQRTQSTDYQRVRQDNWYSPAECAVVESWFQAFDQPCPWDHDGDTDSTV